MLTQTDVDMNLIEDVKIQVEQPNGDPDRPIQTVNMLKLPRDFFENATVQGDLVIPKVTAKCTE